MQNSSAAGGKRKKPRSFLQKAKKFGRQGQRGRGTNIAQDEYDYLVRVMEQWRDGFPSDDERTVFVGNVFRQMEGDERNLAGNQLASRVIELLLPSADQRVVAQFCAALGTDLRLICLDPFASHVLEKLLLLTCFSNPTSSSTTTTTTSSASGGPLPVVSEDNIAWAKKVCRFLTNNLDDFGTDTYASHLLRTCLECVSGSRAPAASKGGNHNNNNNNSKQTEGYAQLTQFLHTADHEFEEILETFSEKILGMDIDQIYNELASSVVQVFLRSAGHKHRKPVKTVLKFLLDRVFVASALSADDQLHESDETAAGAGGDGGAAAASYLDEPGLVRLLEAVVEVAGVGYDKLFAKLYERVFSGQVAGMATHPGGNFVLQRLFDRVADPDVFHAAWSELAGSLESVISSGCTGVLLALVKCSTRLEKEQAAILEKISAALHCDDSMEKLAAVCVRMVPRERLEDDSLTINLHGSLIVQEMLKFNKPIKIVRSLLALEPPELRKVLGDPRGSHIADCYMQSKTVGEKSREGLVRRLAGEFCSLCCSKHGSRALDSIWKYSSLKMKQVIVEELAQSETQLNSHPFGKFVARSCAVSVWKHQKEEWKKVVTRAEKDLQMFSDILGDSAVLLPSKRKSELPVVESQENGGEAKKLKPATEYKLEEPVKTELPAAEDSSGKKKKKSKKQKSYFDDL